LVPVEGDSLPPFDAGAHIDVHVPDGPVRQYSLYELPGEPRRYRIGVLRDPQSRGGSARLLEAVYEGDVLAVSAPRNHFALAAGPPQQQLDARAAIGSPAAGRHLYVCDPAGFMDHVLGTARALGWDEAHLHREYFAAAPVDHSTDGPFELELRKSGRIIRVAA